MRKFLNLLDKDLIMFDIRIGSYQSGRNFGKAHDHGSGFRILEKNLNKLYSEHEKVE
ncbi:MAG: MvaI/BcnI family restriction endonuclease [Bacteroidales bacterium]|nr:MvaI/BcnI family restriction endonuclease [Bacteroidales bacterium]MDD2204162.1 MvaI/BcnI family restriction endonuclease [Bacteroidales bacterium]MDD3151808.1 MvaI/BcnI family restriction endonuclease [Bacteroidales bacterium]MDD3914733.1 MvaI/BcnI family restriction endonuclease [Bacteroidales bacterium]MDD4633591.1 MvaI/BcnI family restriction endonuclease [Bacteroidales bacterium]